MSPHPTFDMRSETVGVCQRINNAGGNNNAALLMHAPFAKTTGISLRRGVAKTFCQLFFPRPTVTALAPQDGEMKGKSVWGGARKHDALGNNIISPLSSN
jgi:hypothetical protein